LFDCVVDVAEKSKIINWLIFQQDSYSIAELQATPCQGVSPDPAWESLRMPPRVVLPKIFIPNKSSAWFVSFDQTGSRVALLL